MKHPKTKDQSNFVYPSSWPWTWGPELRPDRHLTFYSEKNLWRIILLFLFVLLTFGQGHFYFSIYSNSVTIPFTLCTLYCFNAKQFINVKSNQMLWLPFFHFNRCDRSKNKTKEKSWTKPLQKSVKWRGKRWEELLEDMHMLSTAYLVLLLRLLSHF